MIFGVPTPVALRNILVTSHSRRHSAAASLRAADMLPGFGEGVRSVAHEASLWHAAHHTRVHRDLANRFGLVDGQMLLARRRPLGRESRLQVLTASGAKFAESVTVTEVSHTFGRI